MTSLPSNYVIKSLLEHQHSINSTPYCLFLEKMISKQRLKVKSSIIDANNYLNKILLSFNPLYKEFFPNFQLVSRSLMMDLTFIFIFIFYFIILFFSFLFLFLEQLWLGVISYAVTSVTN